MTPTDDTKTRSLGHCQICEAEQKLRGERLVHHGYRRPGDGNIYGSCMGVDAVPYEMSCELVKACLVGERQRLADATARHQALASGAVTYFEREEYTGRSINRGRPYAMRSYALGVSAPYQYEAALTEITHKARSFADALAREADRLEKRISAWKLAPVRSVEERVAEERAARAVRAEEREAARAAKAAKVAATKAKQEALASKRQAVIDDFARRFVALAADPTPANKGAAIDLAREMTKTKNRFFGALDLRCPDALIALGLATKHPDGWLNTSVLFHW